MTTNTEAMRAAPVLVRDLAEIIGKTSVEVCVAMRDLGFKPMRSVNMEVSGEEALAVAKHFAALAQAEQRQVVPFAHYKQVVDALSDLLGQVETFCVANGEADFETGRALQAMQTVCLHEAVPQPDEPAPRLILKPEEMRCCEHPACASFQECGEKMRAAPQLAPESIEGMDDMVAQAAKPGGRMSFFRTCPQKLELARAAHAERRRQERERNLRALAVPTKALVPGTYARVSANDPAPAVSKENPLVCEAYRDLVRAMPCMHCGHPPRSQFCHGDQGKGMGLKTDDRTGWPGCGVHDGKPGCHWLLGTSGRIPKAERRELEERYARQTRAAILAAGTWPKNLPKWSTE